MNTPGLETYFLMMALIFLVKLVFWLAVALVILKIMTLFVKKAKREIYRRGSDTVAIL